MRKPLSVVALAVALVGSDAAAQQSIIDGWSWSTLVPSVAQTDILGTHLRELRNEQERRNTPPPDVSRLG